MLGKKCCSNVGGGRGRSELYWCCQDGGHTYFILYCSGKLTPSMRLVGRHEIIGITSTVVTMVAYMNKSSNQ